MISKIAFLTLILLTLIFLKHRFNTKLIWIKLKLLKNPINPKNPKNPIMSNIPNK